MPTDRDDDRPPPGRRSDDSDRPPPSGNGMAAAALILGLMSLFFGPLAGVLAVILGLVAVRKPTGKGMAVAGLITGGLFTGAWVCGSFFAVGLVRESAARRQTSNNFKQLALAAHNYESAYGVMPAAFVRRPNESPWQPVNTPDLSDRLGWRVNLLPYLEYENVYRQFDTGKPWDAPQNRPLADVVVLPYADTDARTDPSTRVRCFLDNGAMFDSRGTVRMVDVTDGTSNTILYVEGGDKVTWTRFQEYKFDPNGQLPALGKPDKPTFWVAMGDGSVRSVRKSVNPATLKAAITRNGGEVTPPLD